jgi:2-keto-4-pentenoate hydratase/2-oxohepta-3-ene-1,7-dioic acid hydratase in catechol pathway
MRLCRHEKDGAQPAVAFYFDERIVPLTAAARLYEEHTHKRREALLEGPGDDLLAHLPHGARFEAAREVARWIESNPRSVDKVAVPTSKTRLLTPIPRPPKLFLLAGNYAEHVREGGGIALERQKTFPYVFMKPPSTTLNHPGAPVPIPANSPDAIDWEVELGVVIGKRARRVEESAALACVAGYTVVNDISDRRFRPNPGREARERDSFFDWLHGKWHDGFCPLGPCVRSADSVPDPQALRLTLKVNGKTRQDATSAQQIFPVAAVIAFISSIVTLEPGDIISTGTPSGVGSASGTFLAPGDRLEAAIEGIGVLENPVVAEG